MQLGLFFFYQKKLSLIKSECPIYRGALWVTITTIVLVIDVYVDTYLAGYGQYPNSDIIQEGVTYIHPLTLYMGAIGSYKLVTLVTLENSIGLRRVQISHFGNPGKFERLNSYSFSFARFPSLLL